MTTATTATTATAPMLELEGIETAYGAKQALFGVSMNLARGEVVTLMGRNGMGKTTTVHSVLGFTPARAGTIRFLGEEITRLAPHTIARRGIGLVPEGRQIFPNLTVHENLIATAANRLKALEPWTADRIYALFPRLAERKSNMGNQLSGGEQQMLAIGRALMTNPLLLVLDEATEGLAPLIREEIWTCLVRLRATGQSILLIDKNVEALARIADRHYILEKGRVVWQGDSAALRADTGVWHRYLGV
jgi:branched-chain amino acid transport system ATP-binding protein